MLTPSGPGRAHVVGDVWHLRPVSCVKNRKLFSPAGCRRRDRAPVPRLPLDPRPDPPPTSLCLNVGRSGHQLSTELAELSCA